MQNLDPLADADIRYCIEEYKQQNFHDGCKFYGGAECR